MWYKVQNDDDVKYLMDRMCCFHDSCIKEIKYVSGSYVEDDLGMHALNDKRIISMIIQRQYEADPVVELEFSKVKYMKLCPVDEMYTSEIFSAVCEMRDGLVYWYDAKGFAENDDCCGTEICSTELRWRVVNNCLGDKAIYGEIAE